MARTKLALAALEVPAPQSLRSLINPDLGANLSDDTLQEVGALLLIGNNVLLVASKQVHSGEGYSCGFEPGHCVEANEKLRPEAAILAAVAKRGISTTRLALYVAEFPCFWSLQVFARSGITHLYYADEFPFPEGVALLKENGVEVIHVQV